MNGQRQSAKETPFNGTIQDSRAATSNISQDKNPGERKERNPKKPQFTQTITQKLERSKWLINTPIDKLINSNTKFVPEVDKIFKMFYLLPYDHIRVVIMGQDPYTNVCPLTKIPYACGPAFLVPDNVNTCPPSLKNLFIELRNDIGCSKRISFNQIKNRIKSWINQGVFLTNSSLTRGIESTYLDNHKNLWLQFTIDFLKIMERQNCIIVLLGKTAWELSKFISEDTTVLKFYHPSSRNNEFMGSKMFSKINQHLSTPIAW